MKENAVPKILITGFKPFLGADSNPSEYLSIELSSRFSEVDSLILPVEFVKAFEVLSENLQNREYDFVLMLGLATGRKKIGFEKIGLNWVQSEHRDESGFLPKTGQIQSDAPLALMSQVSVDEIFTALKTENHPVEISFSAGTYVCNDLYFRVLNKFPDLKAVFIHVPSVQEMEMSQQQEILTRIVELISKTRI